MEGGKAEKQQMDFETEPAIANPHDLGKPFIIFVHIIIVLNHTFHKDYVLVSPGSFFAVSSDEEIDYSVEPEFYDPKLDDVDELWVNKQRKSPSSDAVLSCPACFTTLCLDSQR